MPDFPFSIPHSVTALCSGIIAILVIAYLGLIAVVMSYAALTIEFSQSARNDEAAIAKLERQYLGMVAHITAVDYAAIGYAPPAAQTFVPAKGATALR